MECSDGKKWEILRYQKGQGMQSVVSLGEQEKPTEVGVGMSKGTGESDGGREHLLHRLAWGHLT